MAVDPKAIRETPPELQNGVPLYVRINRPPADQSTPADIRDAMRHATRLMRSTPGFYKIGPRNFGTDRCTPAEKKRMLIALCVLNTGNRLLWHLRRGSSLAESLHDAIAFGTATQAMIDNAADQIAVVGQKVRGGNAKALNVLYGDDSEREKRRLARVRLVQSLMKDGTDVTSARKAAADRLGISYRQIIRSTPELNARK
jgi:hypothetical protein